MKGKKYLIPGIASVGFITQYGGGFASGVQIQEYFIKYGIWAFLMPIIAQAIIAACFSYGLKIAYRRKAYNYREFSDQMYGKYSVLFSNLYEAVYVILICFASAVAFGMGAKALSSVTGLSEGISLFIVFICLSLASIFGSVFIRQYSVLITTVVVIALFLILIPNIIPEIDELQKTLMNMDTGNYEKYVSGAYGVASCIEGAFIYAMIQLGSIGLMYQHANSFNDEKEISKSMRMMFFINLVVTELMVVAMFLVPYGPGIRNSSIPLMDMIKGGSDSVYGKIILVIIFISSITTGANFISGAVERFVWMIQRRCAFVTGNVMKYYIMVAILFVLLSFIFSNLGIVQIIKNGYKYIGYGAIITVFIPFVGYAIYNYVIGEKAGVKEEWDI